MTSSSKPEREKTMAAVEVLIAVDVAGALSSQSLNNNLYMMDTSGYLGATGEGTNELQTRVTNGESSHGRFVRSIRRRTSPFNRGAEPPSPAATSLRRSTRPQTRGTRSSRPRRPTLLGSRISTTPPCSSTGARHSGSTRFWSPSRSGVLRTGCEARPQTWDS